MSSDYVIPRDCAPCHGFPKPVIPVAPILSSNTFGSNKELDFPSVLDLKHKLDVTSGRVAIATALIHAKIACDDEVLVPAFHCESMIAPVRYVGAKPVFYSIDSSAQVDIEQCRKLSSPKTRAMLVTHYFGFPQDIELIKAFCHEQRIILIEDCAHSMFGSSHGRPLGSAGDYTIASTMKFFPVYDGGILASGKHELASIALRRKGAIFELKSAITILERAAAYGRFSVLGKLMLLLAKLKDQVWRRVKTANMSDELSANAPLSADGGFSFDPDWLDIAASRNSTLVVKYANKHRLIARRQANYAHYLSELNGLPGLHFLHNNLPKTVVPLVVPIWFDNGAQVFTRLKEQGVPIWRFGEFLDPAITPEICPQSIRFSETLLQFPCHQEMKNQELAWIIDRIKSALEQAPGEIEK